MTFMEKEERSALPRGQPCRRTNPAGRATGPPPTAQPHSELHSHARSWQNTLLHSEGSTLTSLSRSWGWEPADGEPASLGWTPNCFLRNCGPGSQITGSRVGREGPALPGCISLCIAASLVMKTQNKGPF